MNSTDARSLNPQREADFMNIDETDFASMSRAEQIRHFEVELACQHGLHPTG